MKMLKNNLPIFVVICIFVLAQSAGADDYHYTNTTVGDRASGLGGAYTALSDDPSGCYYNPAGIAFAPDNNLSASVNAVSKSVKTYKDVLSGMDGKTYDWEQNSSSLLPNFFGLVKKFGSGVIGLSYAVPDSINRRQKQQFFNISQVEGDMTQSYTLNNNHSDKTYYIGPSYGYQFTDSLSIGATLYVYYRDKEFIANHLLEFEQGQQWLINQYESKTDWGYRPVAGIIWEPLDKLAIGLSISKTYISSSDNEKQYIERSSLTNTVSANDIEFAQFENHKKDRFPLSISLGVAYFFSPKFLLSGDIAYYSKESDAICNFPEVADGVATFTDRESVYNFAAGTEYYVTDSLALRVGIYSDKASTDSISESVANQAEHVDIYGTNLSITKFTRRSSITMGMSYGYGSGDSQVRLNDKTMFDVEVQNLTLYLSSSYNY